MAKAVRKRTTAKKTPAPWITPTTQKNALLAFGMFVVCSILFWYANNLRHNFDHPKLVDDITTPAAEPATPVVETPAVEEPKVDDASLKKILEMRKFYLAAERADGKIELRTGGNSTWRHHNPGKMIHGDFTRMMGAIGSDGKFAVFPSYEIGRKAMESYLFTDASDYRNQTLNDAFKTYALKDILKGVGVPGTTKLSDLTSEQKDKLFEVIQKKEGWMEGKVTVFADDAEFQEKGW